MLKGTEEISMLRSTTKSLYDPVSSVIAEILLQGCRRSSDVSIVTPHN